MIHSCRAHRADPRCGVRLDLRILVAFSLMACWILGPAGSLAAWTQEPSSNGQYVRATALLPASTAGLVRIPNFPKFQTAWKETHIGQLIDEPSMQPFVEAQRKRIEDELQQLDNKIGIRLEDLSEIASGEVVLAWLPFQNDKRRPFSICLIADVRGHRDRADAILETIDADLKKAGWERRDTEHRQQVVRIYGIKPKPGQLKVEQFVVTLDDERIIAADRDSVVMDLLDSLAGEASGLPIEQSDEFVSVLRRSTEAIQQPILQGGATVALEWFARPFEMGRVLREVFEVDRGNQVDVIKLLENQGFDVVRGVGGVVAINGEKYDLLHRGFVLADQSQLTQAARMLQFTNDAMAAIPAWVNDQAASFNRLNLRIEQAFWASESLVNEAFGDEIFRDIIEGIRDDEDGPQIDLAENVLPNLDDQIVLLTDNVEPADIKSERMLLAIRVKDAKAIEAAIRKAMEVEPDASRIDALPGIEIWQVQRSDTVDDFDKELFGDLELDFGEESTEEAPPLLEHWAISLVPAGPGSDKPYLMFSSHPELLIDCAKRIVGGESANGLAQTAEVQAVRTALQDLGAENIAFDRVFRTKRSLRVKYELLRQGKLKQSDTVLGSLYRRIFEKQDANEREPLDATTLPPLSEIDEHLPDGGGYIQTADEGWAITGFLLK
jgi:hypothetical protein